ncbi:PREDICTED: pyruvate dehydrogenase phosphatase regulatory subunit, mitochondrial isoform X1 [Trachymyrmex cornetzi]|uniref:Pyruvate dehydrogenase phosphatase regulatory subunit, mitochondrial n=1 Tax=Trachymyrmex cornetzi TaxID=471704 RepID=A0A195DQN8_9HYME|nr:PREDICTED: pyruvate dehydrogenase phosphatase regulatory subunit, mitochondrial isoform X1 [Trachymyrmex cornetzi]KYN15161.1 Pyruvate dehydrogenase phosphatase regulatory subunit, mitochondrial [Trachymyrmex cornetzi]
MWKQCKLLYSRGAVQGRKIFSRSYQTRETVTKVTDVTSDDSEYVFPKEARVVICGGGVMGGAVAYHLSLIGLGPETILVEGGRLGGGTTWHASGLVGAFKPSLAQVKLAQDSIALYKELEKKGLSTGWKQCGSLSLARTRDRMTSFRRMKAQSVSRNIECHLVSPEEIHDLCPLLHVEDLIGGLWIPGDGVGDPYQICLTLMQEAQQRGVRVFENCAVTKVINHSGQIEAVETTRGMIKCQHFVNCAGFWARNVGKLSEPHVKVPLHPVEHYYLHTKPIANLDPMIPVIRDLDGYIYFRENEGRLLAGGFEPVAKPAFEDGIIPESMDKRFLPEDWDHFHILLEQMLHRIPSLGNAVLERLCNGPEAFSPDCRWIVGEAPEIRNYYIAAGMKTVGISAAGGVGRATAELIVNGSTSLDMYELDVSRFLGLHNNRKFLRDRVREVPGMHYALQYPHLEFKTGRNLRMSPIYPKLRDAGAVFGQVMGYERPSWFQPDHDCDLEFPDGFQRYKIAYTNTFGKPPWFDAVAQEYAVCREAIGLSDYSSFTKIDLWSNDTEVVDLLQYLCSNDVDVPVGSIIHTGMQNHLGGYENDCSLARIAPNHYMMIAPTIQQTRCKNWIHRHLPVDGSVAVSDVTSAYTAICIMGPATRKLLTELTDVDLNPKNFPFFTFKELDVGLANGIRTMNLTHTGELGYVLYIPNEFALHVYTRLIEAGAKYGMKHAGYYATRALRVEKFYAFWGQDLDTFTTPLECGRSWRVKFDKEVNFIGRDALLKQREQGVQRKYVQLLLNDHDLEFDTWCWGGEPIYRNGKYCGMTTTTGYGFTFKKQVCLGFVQNFDSKDQPQEVTNEYILSGDYEVNVAGIMYSAKCHLHSPNLPTKFPDKERDAYHATRDQQSL